MTILSTYIMVVEIMSTRQGEDINMLLSVIKAIKSQNSQFSSIMMFISSQNLRYFLNLPSHKNLQSLRQVIDSIRQSGLHSLYVHIK